MREKKLLLIGYGDIARRFATIAINNGAGITAVARSPKPVTGRFWQGAVADAEMLRQIGGERFDTAVVTLTPDARTDEAYRQAYVENSRRLADLWRTGDNRPGRVIFVSSTSVYGQDNGEWVDEDSPTVPRSFAGERLLEAEQLWRESAVPASIVRFSGIYGPGRNHLINQVKAGRSGRRGYTNRIHADDCAGVLIHLCQKQYAGEKLSDLILASDDAPVPGVEVSRWLAGQMNLVLKDEDDATLSGPIDGKRCNNRRLRQSGYRLKYPSYQEGYRDILRNC